MNISLKNQKAIGYLQNYDPRILVMMPVKNAKPVIIQSLLSLANQVGVMRKMLVLISDDQSKNHWETDSNIKNILSDQRFLRVKTRFNHISQNRNFLIDFPKYYAKNLEILLRLDADDFLEESNIIHTVEKYFFSSTFYFYKPQTRQTCHWLLMGNTLSCNGLKLNRINYATNQLKNRQYLLERLSAMRYGLAEAELPSCNLIWKSEHSIHYPALKSAEDHLLLTDCLLRYKNDRFYIEEEKLYANYSLSGNLTANNKQAKIYQQSRQFIFNYALNYGQN